MFSNDCWALSKTCNIFNILFGTVNSPQNPEVSIVLFYGILNNESVKTLQLNGYLIKRIKLPEMLSTYLEYLDINV